MRDSIMNWDKYFMEIAKLTSQRSKDPSTQVGAVIVRDKRILSTGYNGFPFGIADSEDRWNKENKDTYVIHAEMNAILSARQVIEGSTIYVTLFPCRECAKAIIQSGIKEVVYGEYRDKYADSKLILEEAGIKVRSFELEFLRAPVGIKPGNTFKTLAFVEYARCKDLMTGTIGQLYKPMVSPAQHRYFSDDDVREMTGDEYLFDLSLYNKMRLVQANSAKEKLEPSLLTIKSLNEIFHGMYEFYITTYRAEITLKCISHDSSSEMMIDQTTNTYYYKDGDRYKQILQSSDETEILRQFHSDYKDFYILEDIHLIKEVENDNNSYE